MKTKFIKLLLGATIAMFLVSFNIDDDIEKPDRSVIIPPPSFKSGNRSWDSDLTLSQVEQLTRIKPAAGIDESWVSWLQTSLCGLVLEPKTYDNDGRVMVAYGLMGNGNHYSDLMNESQVQRSKIIKAYVAKGMSKDAAEKASPNYWQMLIGSQFGTKEQKDNFLSWCMENSRYILWTLSKEEARIYTMEMWAAHDSVNRPDWLEKEKSYYNQLESKDKVRDFTLSGPDGKTEGRKLVCFIYRRCLDGSTTPEEAVVYMKKMIQFFEKEAASH